MIKSTSHGKGRDRLRVVRSRKRPDVPAIVGCAVLLSTFLASLACREERAYTVVVKDGVRYVHNIRPASAEPVAGLAFVRKIG